MKSKNNQNSKKTEIYLAPTLRKHESERMYQETLAQQPNRKLSEDKSIREWVHWRIIENLFPYDAAFKAHHLLLPKRAVSESELSKEEKQELEKILIELTDSYSFWMVNFKAKQSIKNHFHIHLLTYKDTREELGF
jgi:galactose-1-phosphate uridylyltransferase